MKTTFKDLGLKPEIIRATREMGFEEATPIQAKSLPRLSKGADLIGQAQTGSGKTAAFGIAMLEKIEPRHVVPQALVIVPTRELAMQVTQEVARLGKYLNVSVVAVYGGTPIGRQIYEITGGVHIIVGTPGRIIDHLEKRTLDLSSIKIVVLDEADRMLDMGFIGDVEFILKHVPKERQTLLFAATMPPEIKNLARRFMRAPEHLKVDEDAIPLDKIKQTYILVEPRNKVEVLLNCLEQRKMEHVLIFTRTKHTADKISRILDRNGFGSLALHGNLSQNQRDRAMNAFRKAHVNILVATDLAARGIDVLNISHVINYDLPEEPDIYAHRVGRTGRAGASGEAVSLVTPDQYRELGEIISHNNVKIEREMIEGCIKGEWDTRRPPAAYDSRRTPFRKRTSSRRGRRSYR